MTLENSEALETSHKNVLEFSQRYLNLLNSKKQIDLDIKALKEEFDEETLRLRQLLNTPIVDLNLSVRATNCLRAAEVNTLGELVQYKLHDLLRFRNFGKKSMVEIEELLDSLGLSFGMDISKIHT